MAYNISGTFTSSQFLTLKTFGQVQRVDLQKRRSWLSAQLTRNGVFITEYDDETNYPISFSASPGSYADKLLHAYRILGGIPERDMLLRTSDMPVFLTRGANIDKDPDGLASGGFSDVYSNGRRMRGGQRFDRDLGLQIEKFKKWQLEAIKHKREHLEFKIKRALDYSDQLQNEMALIDELLGSGPNSVDDQLINIQVAMSADGALNVVDDADDVYGLNIGRIGDRTFPDAVREADDESERL